MNKKRGRKKNQGIMVTNALIGKSLLSWAWFSLGKEESEIFYVIQVTIALLKTLISLEVQPLYKL